MTEPSWFEYVRRTPAALDYPLILTDGRYNWTREGDMHGQIELWLSTGATSPGPASGFAGPVTLRDARLKHLLPLKDAYRALAAHHQQNIDTCVVLAATLPPGADDSETARALGEAERAFLEFAESQFDDDPAGTA